MSLDERNLDGQDFVGLLFLVVQKKLYVVTVSIFLFKLGTIQVLRHQRGGWVGSENGNF